MSAKPASYATLSAIAFAAYTVADFAHEGLGHGGACLVSGGHIKLLSTTFEDCSVHSRLIDGAGPVAGIAVALLALAWVRLAPPRAVTARLFLCLVLASAIFWNTAYMIKSGVLDKGDWAFVIAGLTPGPVWHAGLVIVGVVLYAAAIRVVGASMAHALPGNDEAGLRPVTFALIAYVAAGALSAAAALLDPRGPATVLNDALPSSLGAIGLVRAAGVLGKRLPGFRVAVPSSPAWIACGLASAAFFVFVLGRGVRF